MKKFKFILSIFIMFLFNIDVLAAGSATIKVNNTTIENGSSVKATVTASNVAAWNITITSSGATNGCTKKFADATSDGANTTKTFTVTCKSNSTGIINFVMSGDITSSDGTNSKISGSKTVKVVKAREKSSNNSLKSLSVEGYEISPKFDEDINEYTVSVPNTVDKIKINAKKEDSYASLDGIGEKTVNEGANTFEIVVTSETGVSNVYKLTVNVMDQNPIYVSVNGKDYSLVKIAKNLEKPDLFEETIVKINDNDIPAFYNEYSDITLVGLKDEVGNIELFIYDKGLYKPYNVYMTDKLSIIFLEMKDVPTNYVKTSYTINEEKTTLYKLKGEDKLLIYGMNLSNGKKNYYTFDKEDKTLQVFDIDKYESNIEELNNHKYIIFGLGIVILFLLIIVILFMVKARKLKKLLNLKSDKKK